jgi:hypothetical protein
VRTWGTRPVSFDWGLGWKVRDLAQWYPTSREKRARCGAPGVPSYGQVHQGFRRTVRFTGSVVRVRFTWVQSYGQVHQGVPS